VLTQAEVDLILEGVGRRDDRIAMLYDLRRSFDSKYSHLWHEYEYYLARSRELERTLAGS
jgi:hypothetical protein